MKKLKLDLEHCYGIKKLQAEFNFEAHGGVFTIYAANGVMKTSLANTLRDVSKGTTTSDRIWKENQTKRVIHDENGSDLAPESVFVIEPYNGGYRSDQIPMLLVNDKLRIRYQEIHKEIDEKAEILIGELKTHAGLKKGVREEFSVSITDDQDDFFGALDGVKDEVANDAETALGDVVFADIFNSKVEPVLKDPDFISKIEEYIQKYDELVTAFFKVVVA